MLNPRHIYLALSLFFAGCFVIADSIDDTDVSAIQKLVDLCQPSEIVIGAMGNECERALDEHFISKPVWEFLQFTYRPTLAREIPDGLHAGERSGVRVKELTHSRLQQIPKWQDVFDDLIEERDILVSQVFQDKACKKLIFGPINTELDDRCAGDELYKYFTYLDTCLSGLESYEWLFQRSVGTDGGSFYEYILGDIGVYPEDERRARLTKFNELVLNSIWLAHRCEHMPVSIFDESLNVYGKVTSPSEFATLKYELDIGRDFALMIATRAGNQWALYTYEPPAVSDDVQFWKSLFEVEPYLVHYWLAIGKSNLSTQDELNHAFKAYSMKFETPSTETMERYLVDFFGGLEHGIPKRSVPVIKVVISETSEGIPNQSGTVPSPIEVPSSRANELLKLVPANIDRQLEYPW